MPIDDTQGNVQAAIAAGAALGDPRAVINSGEGLYAVVPAGYQIHDLEKYFPHPLRVRQHVTLNDTESFVAYLAAYGSPLVTRVFFAAEGESFEAVIDYHRTASAPYWCSHTVTYKPVRSVEFTTWMERNGKGFSQVDFARFIEQNLPDVVEPDGAVLLEVALSIEARKEATFSSGIRLNNGQIQFQIDEVIRGTARKGTLEIPEQFVLGIAIHSGGPAYRIPARLRWRLAEGKPVFWYELVRPHRFIEDATSEIRAKITADACYPILSGVPK
jgi:uncharacterized protein YfdQ (DUF2303 family)